MAAGVQTATPFVDTIGHVFHKDILGLSGSGITRGCNPPVDDEYCPNDPVTRGQMAAFLDRALDLAPSPVDFFDDGGTTLEANVNVLAASGITRGCNPPDNDRFYPDDLVTRVRWL